MEEKELRQLKSTLELIVALGRKHRGLEALTAEGLRQSVAKLAKAHIALGATIETSLET